MRNNILTKKQFERQAFAHWLRKGIVYDNYDNYLQFAKAEYKSESETQTRKLYVWRSMDDNKVRGSHAEHDDRIFDWNSEMVKPGEDYGCRCYAEFVEIDDVDGFISLGDLINSGNMHLLTKLGEIGRISYLSLGEEFDGKSLWEREEVIVGSLEGLEREEKELQSLSSFINSEEPRGNVKEVERQNVLRVGKWFYDKVTNNGDWDYKKKIPYGEYVGNFNYGLTGRAMLRSWNREVAETVLLRLAGWKQI